MERHDNESLLGKMLVQMTGEELVAIVRMAAPVFVDSSPATLWHKQDYLLGA